MDEIKRKNFEQEHPGRALPVHEATAKEVSAVKRVLIARLGLPQGADGLGLVKEIASRSSTLTGMDANSTGFDLARLLVDLVGARLDDEVLLNWYRFEHLDRVRTSELARYFDDIWYPSVDDLDVVDPSCDWVMSIFHHGGIRLLKVPV